MLRATATMGTRERDFLLLIGLTLLAVASRVYGLWEWDLTDDEIPTYAAAAERFTRLINPAYYALVVVSFKLFGPSEWSARLPAFLLAVLSVPVFFCTWRNVFDRNVALFGTVLVLFSSWHLHYSQFARFYSGVFLFGSLAYYCFYQALSKDSFRYLLGALLASAAGVLFHLTVVMVPASCAVFAVIIALSSRARAAGYSGRIAWIYLGICAVGGLASFNFLLGALVGRHQMSGGATFGNPPLEMILQITRQVQLSVAVASFLGALFLLRRETLKGIFFLLGVALPMLFVIAVASYANSRAVYMFYALPLLLLLAGYFCEQVRQAFASERLLGFSAMGMLLVLMLPETISHYTGRSSVDVREAVSFVTKAYQPGDRIVSFVMEFSLYLDEEYPVAAREKVKKLRSREGLEAYSSKGGRVWVVLNAYRTPRYKGLLSWLSSNGSLVWRKYERRLDYTVRGYEVFLLGEECQSGRISRLEVR